MKMINHSSENENSVVLKSNDLFGDLGKQTKFIAATTEKNEEVGSTTGGGTNYVREVMDESSNEESQKGVTRLLLTRIPFFREVILSSFFCSHCSFKNSEIQSAGEIQQKGCRYELRLLNMSDFSRQVVKSDTCSVKFIELDIEIPPGRGQLTNVEGLLRMTLEDLELKQPERKEQTPEIWAKIRELIAKGYQMLDGASFPFRLAINDPAGNSWIEPDHNDGVGKLLKFEFARTVEQNEMLGLGRGNEEEPLNGDRNQQLRSMTENDDIIPDEVYSFPATCPGCTKYCVTHMKMVEIPHFKQVVIMSTVCEQCGYRSNEVKTGGEIPEKGKKITLKVMNSTDLARDILKAESCALECPELKLSVNPGTLGGRFTTVEGLLTQIRDDLHQNVFDVEAFENSADGCDIGGDSIDPQVKSTWKFFFDQIDKAIKGQFQFTIILTDPLASSYVQNICLPDEDPHIKIEEYERTTEEENDLGLTDMRTENYASDIPSSNENTEMVAEKAHDI
ncbi:Zinc finger protein zpr1 [Golovinomyces cichoracearum]|uniref:Zinc finger protein zpr1 n=1 Tax=Golovinomyces cichoracearum TaxID=62708 RepID=A0A420IHV7_9PEZI|nr:Zinc finger protein zpr1 [Golovinomyces cichoracearum]